MSDLHLTVGDDMSLTVKFNDSAGNPVNDAAAVYTLNVRARPNDSGVLFAATASQSAPGVAQIAVSRALVSGYTAPAVWAYDVKVTQTGGSVTTLDKGKFYLDESGLPDSTTGDVIVSGPAGPPGPTGPQGPGGGEYFVFTQSTPASTWGPIAHNFGRPPVVARVLDSSNELNEGVITDINNNTAQLDFSAAFAGTAYLE